jgi:hypothetical protein
MRGPLIALGAAMVLWGGTVWLSPRAGETVAADRDLLYYPSGRFLKEAVLGYDEAAASLAWLRVVQYYGEHVRSDRKFDLLFHMCDVTTDLDPHFEEPYTFGAFVLISEGRNPKEGMDLLEKGREMNPTSWKVFFESGFVYYIAWQDVPKAAHFFSRAARMPGAPEYADRFAAWVSYRAGDLRTSILLWKELAKHSESPAIRKKAEAKVIELSAKLEAMPGARMR